jgi:tRNA U55 pseudouridine synthase TruB
VKYKFYPSDDVVLVSYYVSNRGVHHISILWKPQHVSTEEVMRAVRRALGLEEVVKLIVKDGTVVEEICEEN